VIITFKKPDFICKVGYANRDVPRKAGFRWMNERKHWCTQSPVVAARLREYADESAKVQINRILLLHEPWAGRISYPKNFKPMPFQLDGVVFAMSRNRSYLAFDPGLGKTATAAMIARTLKPLHVVYICPPFLKQTVQYEFEKLDAPLTLVVGDSMIHRDAVQKEIGQLTQKGNSLLFVDEAHRFKTENSRRTKTLFKTITPLFSKVVFLSGTPMPNRPIELFPLLSSAAPETIDFKNKFEFGRKYCAAHRNGFGWDFNGASNMKELAEKVKGAFMMRRRKSEVLKDLPPKTEELVLIGDNLSPTLSAVDRGILKSFSPEDLMGHLAPNDHVSTYRKELGKLKSPKAAAFIKEILDDTTESILVFAIHKDVVARLAKDLSDYNPLIITGDVPTQKRNQIVTLFQNDNTQRVIIGNVDACGLGFTLTKATRVVFAEFSWVPAINDQASDRAHRIGQKDNVLVQYLVFKNSIDRTVIETILRKRNVIKHM
jgi:SWI/SNF-related matrix-associated actin-dependent regulator 1 of chromatin subfamily A